MGYKDKDEYIGDYAPIKQQGPSREKVLDTDYTCRGCSSAVKKFIDMTPDEILGKYLCNCRDRNNELVGPIFPLLQKRAV